MQVHNKCVVKGAGFFVGDVEGQAYNTGQLFIEEPFDSTKPNYKGFRTVEYKCENSEVVKPIMHLPFPITAEVTMEISATKRGQVIVVTGLKPLDVQTTGMPGTARPAQASGARA
jgi:hypothetical protein